MEFNSLFQGCDLALSARSLCIHAPNERIADRLVNAHLYDLARQAQAFQLETTVVSYPDAPQPYEIPAAMAKNDPLASRPVNRDLLGDDYLKVWELLQAEQAAGKIVIFTSNVTRDREGKRTTTPHPVMGRDFCYKTSDTLLPSRATWTSDRWTGYNYRLSWRKCRHNFRELNPEYDRLKELLERDQVVPNYHYRLFRPPAEDEVTGALCEYNTTYFRIRLPWYNDEVRVGISDPRDWRVIEEGQKRELLVR